ncbi:MAG: exodeoxyribonuclease V subunit alpha, partial [Bacteroidota bacterium]
MRDLSPETVALLDALAESEDARPIDLALARMLAEHDPERAREVALAAALVSAMQRRGHTAVDLDAWAGEPFPGAESIALPAAGLWRQRLDESPTVSDGGTVAPLVLDDAGRLYLYRLWRAEGRVARRISALVGMAETSPEASGEVREAFAALFPEAASGDRQALAAAGALRHRLAVVAGGPGTGKTTTVAKLLALLLSADPDLSIALATPTGKAANRLGESIVSRVADLPVAPEVRERVPREAMTLHRLLQYSPTRRRWRRGPDAPVPADVVVVDETSMADLLLFDALLAALRPGARLVLLGDADQLPSVGAGAVFGDLCASGAREAVGPGFQAFCDALGVTVGGEGGRGKSEEGQSDPAPEASGDSGAPTGRPAGSPLPDSDALADAVVRLTVSHRFADDSGIGRLAAALREGDAPGVRDVLASGAADVACVDPADRAEAIWIHAEPHARALCTAETPEAALEVAAAFRMLAPTRGGRWGVHALNRLVERRLSEEGLRLSPTDPWYHGRPILVTENDYDRDLFNGDVGVVWRPAGVGGWRQRPVVVFEGKASGEVREVPVAQLPEHETAWAMTVHKSQGSEFDDVLVVLPTPGSAQARRLTRELVYTAVTRAKGASSARGPSLTILGGAEQVAEAAERAERRASGLAERLR